MISRYALWLVAGSLLGGCTAGDEGEGSSDPQDAVVELCVGSCLAPLCAGNVDPSPDYPDVCRSNCEQRVEQAQAGGCLPVYRELLACLDELSCAEYLEWYSEVDAAPCSEFEVDVASACPSIQLRD